MALQRPGQTGPNLLSLLERRLDNVVYRLGLADSRAQARQLVSHGHLEVNGRKLNIPSALVDVGDQVRVKESSRGNAFFREMAEILEHRSVPSWLSLNAGEMAGTVLSLPTRDQIGEPIEEQLIVEYYSR
jgi:small subunit ribosomal protein S4